MRQQENTIAGFSRENFKEWYKNEYDKELTDKELEELESSGKFNEIKERFATSMHDLMCSMAGIP